MKYLTVQLKLKTYGQVLGLSLRTIFRECTSSRARFPHRDPLGTPGSNAKDDVQSLTNIQSPNVSSMAVAMLRRNGYSGSLCFFVIRILRDSCRVARKVSELQRSRPAACHIRHAQHHFMGAPSDRIRPSLTSSHSTTLLPPTLLPTPPKSQKRLPNHAASTRLQRALSVPNEQVRTTTSTGRGEGSAVHLVELLRLHGAPNLDFQHSHHSCPVGWERGAWHGCHAWFETSGCPWMSLVTSTNI